MKRTSCKTLCNGRKYLVRLALHLCFALLPLVIPTFANAVTYAFNGVVTTIWDMGGGLPHPVSVGERFSGNLSYHVADTPFCHVFNSNSVVYGISMSYLIDFENIAVTGSSYNAGELYVSNNENGAPYDEVRFEDLTPVAIFKDTGLEKFFYFDMMTLAFCDGTGGALESVEVPRSLNLGAFDAINLAIPADERGVMSLLCDVTEIHEVQTAPVPEPSATVLLVVGFSLITVIKRWRLPSAPTS